MKFFASLVVGILLAIPFLSTAQHQQPRPPADQIIQTFTPTPGYAIPPAVFINPMDYVDQENWDIKLQQKGGINHSNENPSKLDSIKAVKTAAKIALVNGGNLIVGEEGEGGDRSVVPVTPVVLSTFEANDFDGWFPPDNNMAISDDGYIVSVINSAVSYHDADGNELMSNMGYNIFLADLNLSNFIFDPKILYDPVLDRFIMVVLSGNEPSTSTVVVGFSVSQNPEDGWNFYTYSGNFLQGSWFDFPNIAVSETDLFITGNLFSGGFDQTVVLQIKKENGPTGGVLDWEFFNNVQNGNGDDAFTVVPGSYGYDGAYGPGIFMVSNFSFGGNQIFLYEVTDSVNANQTINVYSVGAPFYDSPGNALQAGSSDVLDTGGSRIRNAFYNNGLIHFVYSTDFQSGFSGVRYQRIDVSDITIQTETFGQNQFDYSYPTVVPFGMSDTSQAVMIAYLQSSANTFPGIGVVNCDDDMEFSDPVLVKKGESAINPSGENNERWGDYSGGGRRHSSDYPNAWFTGCIGKGGDYGNWIFEVSDDPNNSGLPPIAEFEGTPRAGDAPHTATFYDLSNNGVSSYNWIFEGGTPATANTPTVTVSYPDPAKFDVTLIVENDFGVDTLYRNDYINVTQDPLVDYTADPTTGSAPLTVNFTNMSTNATEYQWSFPGAEPSSSTDENPTVVYNNPGTYNVNLIGSSDFGFDNLIKFGYIVVEESVATYEQNKEADLNVFPNPISGTFTVDFFTDRKMIMDMYIIDASGKRVKTLLQGRVKGGRNILSFNRNALPGGTYFLIIKDDGGNIVKNELIVVGG